MLTSIELNVIEEYVDGTYYDKDKLIKYLNMHDIVGNDVFSYCDKHLYGHRPTTYSVWLEDEDGYLPLPVSDFIKRIPFYFYTKDLNNLDIDNSGTLDYIFSASNKSDGEHNDPEEVYSALEFMFYELKLPLNRIFSYWVNQSGVVSGNGFFQWNHYLHLCQKNGDSNYFPERFITAYNTMLEKSNCSPIIYEITDPGLGDAYIRYGQMIEFEGTFPCDNDGNPIMRWIGVRTQNAGKITCTCEKSKGGYLRIELQPNTVIHVLNFYNSREDIDEYWYQVYAGPQTMEFDYPTLKRRRLEMDLTQQQVADAIGTNVRTYQKWEKGETTPDGHYLLRLLNWLDIPDVQDIVTYKNIND